MNRVQGARAIGYVLLGMELHATNGNATPGRKAQPMLNIIALARGIAIAGTERFANRGIAWHGLEVQQSKMIIFAMAIGTAPNTTEHHATVGTVQAS